jgi:TetR/AcrR family acrAB operon transcriptional repressor
MKRTKEDAKETRLLILKTALREFEEKGYSASSLNSVAARMNMTKGAVYWHFPSKKKLFDALISEMAEDANSRLARIFDRPGRAMDILNEYIETYLSLLEEDKNYAAVQRILFFHIENSEELKADYEQKKNLLAVIHSSMTGLIARIANEEGLTPTAAPRICAFALLSYTYGLANTWLFYKGDLSIAANARTFGKILVDGIFIR